MTLRFFLFSIYSFFAFISLAQNPQVDSLLGVINSSNQDTVKLRVLYQITEICEEKDIIKYGEQAVSLGETLLQKYKGTTAGRNVQKYISGALSNIGFSHAIRSDFQRALDYYRSSLEISLKIDDTLAIANRYLNIAGAFVSISQTDSAMKYYEMGIEISKLMNDKNGLSWGYANLGRCYLNKGNYKEALDYYLKGLKISEEIGNMANISVAYNNIAIVYVDQNQMEKAEEYYMKALDAAQKSGDKNQVALIMGNLGDIYTKQKHLNKALEFLREGARINKEIGNKAQEAHSHYNTAICFMNLSDSDSLSKDVYVDSSLFYAINALRIHEEINHKEGMAYGYELLGKIYDRKKHTDKCVEYALKAFKLGQEIQYLDIIQRAAHLLSAAYAKQKNFEEAYKYHQLYATTKDTILNQESSKQIAEMQTKYETEKKEQQITLLNKDKELQNAQLNRQKIIIWSVAGGLLVVLILSIFIFRERRKSERLLLNILPLETARELKKNGKATAKHYESVTVMFTDFKGFTTISEKLSAEELVNELDFLFKKFDQIISKYPIEKIKTIGDAYMCASGLPTPNSNHAEYITKAALEIQTWMTSQNTKWQLRIGIHSGPVTAGVVGDKKFAYDIWGDTVNTASRMESSGEPNKINISGTTHEFIKNKFKCEFRGKIPAKNKGEIDMYFVEKLLS